MPNILPPLRRLLGSIDNTAKRSFKLLTICLPNDSINVLLPTPGVPI